MATGRRKARQACRFCLRNDRPLSKQHLVPEWMRKYIQIHPAAEGHYSRHFKVNLSPHAPRLDTTVRHRNGAAESRRLRLVCRNCNGGWMSRLEMQAEQVMAGMLTGQPRTLTEHDQRVLAAWAEQTVMVNECAEPKQVVSTQADRTHLMRTATPAPLTQVWIGAYLDTGRHGSISHDLWQSPRGKRPFILGRIDARIDIVIMGEVVFYVTGARVPEAQFPGLAGRPDFSIRLQQIWPFVEEIDWPSPWRLDHRIHAELRGWWPGEFHGIFHSSPGLGGRRSC